jgi:hypothetical protein
MIMDINTTEMIYMQMEQDLMNLAKEHEVAASNERLWAKGARKPEDAKLHEENAETHSLMARMYRNMLGDVLRFIETYDDEEN